MTDAMPTSSIFVIGSSNTDMVLNVPHLPVPGESVIGGAFSVVQGGKGANQAVAASRAGGKVHFIGCVGKDAFGNNARTSLQREGIHVDHLAGVEHSPTGVALIFVEETGENCIAVAPGANAQVTARHVEAAAAQMQPGDIVLMQQEIPSDVVAYAIEKCYEKGLIVMLNPAPARSLNAALLRKVSFLVPNESEATFLTGIPIRKVEDARLAASQLLALGVANVLITLGAQGVWVANDAGQQLVPGFPVPVVVDTTAAGDVFCGALAVAFTERRDLLDAVAFASAAAALSVTKAGAQPSAPSRSEIDAFLALNLTR